MKLRIDTEKWHWIDKQIANLEIATLLTKEGFVLKDIDDVAYYLADYQFAYDYVHIDSVREALLNCATELGCVYNDVYELEEDIRRYYI